MAPATSGSGIVVIPMTTPLTSVSNVDMLGVSAPLFNAKPFPLISPKLTRVCLLQQRHHSSEHSKQKPSLKKELEDILHLLPRKKMLFNALPFDVCRFSVYKDRMSKTQPHHKRCQYVGQRGIFTCGCPCHLHSWLSHRQTPVNNYSPVWAVKGNGRGPSIWAMPPGFSVLTAVCHFLLPCLPPLSYLSNLFKKWLPNLCTT